MTKNVDVDTVVAGPQLKRLIEMKRDHCNGVVKHNM